jgi:hypothetical protein
MTPECSSDVEEASRNKAVPFSDKPLIVLRTATSIPGYEDLQKSQADPECGDLIRGTGGFRKVRWHAKEWEKVAGRGLCISGATKGFQFF